MTNAIRRVSVITLAVIVVIAMSASAFAGSMTKKEAVKKALNDAHTTKAGVYGLEAELDDGQGSGEGAGKARRLPQGSGHLPAGAAGSAGPHRRRGYADRRSGEGNAAAESLGQEARDLSGACEELPKGEL